MELGFQATEPVVNIDDDVFCLTRKKMEQHIRRALLSSLRMGRGVNWALRTLSAVLQNFQALFAFY